MKQMKRTRKIASNELLTPEGKLLTLQVVLLEAGYVVNMHPLEKEGAGTEWLQGRIELKRDELGIRACYKGQELE